MGTAWLCQAPRGLRVRIEVQQLYRGQGPRYRKAKATAGRLNPEGGFGQSRLKPKGAKAWKESEA